MTSDKLLDYVHSLRNLKKRAYARAYIVWYRGLIVDAPDSRDYDLSFMGAQSVRLAVDEIVTSR